MTATEIQSICVYMNINGYRVIQHDSSRIAPCENEDTCLVLQSLPW